MIFTDDRCSLHITSLETTYEQATIMVNMAMTVHGVLGLLHFE